MCSALPFPEQKKFQSLKSADYWVNSPRPKSRAAVSCLFIADPAKEQRHKKSWTLWVCVALGTPLFLREEGLRVVQRATFGSKVGGSLKAGLQPF